MEERHFRKIRETLSTKVPERHLDLLPRSYEVIGNILLLTMPPQLEEWKHEVAQAYLEVLGMQSVMEKKGISGEYREPGHRLLAGSGTVTIHKENGIRYKIDLSRLMFSSGNIFERIRMARMDDVGPVVDMFAGIGYFTLPLAKHAGSFVVSLEKNPASFKYLEENISLNGLEDKVTAHNMDCRDYEGSGAKRIVMGYVRETHKYLDKAIELASDGCIIHYHQTLFAPELGSLLEKQIGDAAANGGCDIDILDVRTVKKYSPGVSHIVADLRVRF